MGLYGAIKEDQGRKKSCQRFYYLFSMVILVAMLNDAEKTQRHDCTVLDCS